LSLLKTQTERKREEGASKLELTHTQRQKTKQAKSSTQLVSLTGVKETCSKQRFCVECYDDDDERTTTTATKTTTQQQQYYDEEEEDDEMLLPCFFFTKSSLSDPSQSSADEVHLFLSMWTFDPCTGSCLHWICPFVPQISIKKKDEGRKSWKTNAKTGIARYFENPVSCGNKSGCLSFTYIMSSQPYECPPPDPPKRHHRRSLSPTNVMLQEDDGWAVKIDYPVLLAHCYSSNKTNKIILGLWRIIIFFLAVDNLIHNTLYDLNLPFLLWGLVGPCPPHHKDRDHLIRANFCKVYFIKTSFTLVELVFLVKVFRLFRLEWIFFGVRTVWTQCPACLLCLVWLLAVPSVFVMMPFVWFL
jgi:hypothetical protein